MNRPIVRRVPILYTDSVQGVQVCRDDLWAVTTEEIHALRNSAPPDSLAVAQALEMAAKVLRKRLDGIYEEHSYQEEDTGAVIVDRAYDSQAEILEEMEESIRALIPADSAEQVKVGREDTELLDWMESHPWEAYQVIGDANHASEEGQNPNYRAAIAAARDTK